MSDVQTISSNLSFAVRKVMAQLRTNTSKSAPSGRIAFIGANIPPERMDTLRTIGGMFAEVEFKDSEGDPAYIDLTTSGGRGAPQAFLEGFSEVDPDRTNVVLAWLPSIEDENGNDANHYREMLGLLPISLETGEELQDIVPTPDYFDIDIDAEGGAEAYALAGTEYLESLTTARATARQTLKDDKDPKAEVKAIRAERRTRNAVLDLARYRQQDGTRFSVLVGFSDAEKARRTQQGMSVGTEGQVGFFAGQRFNPINIGLYEALGSQVELQWQHLQESAKKLRIVDISCVGAPEKAADVVMYWPDTTIPGGGAPTVIRDYAKVHGIPCINLSRVKESEVIEMVEAITKELDGKVTPVTTLVPVVPVEELDIEALAGEGETVEMGTEI